MVNRSSFGPRVGDHRQRGAHPQVLFIFGLSKAWMAVTLYFAGSRHPLHGDHIPVGEEELRLMSRRVTDIRPAHRR
jgi:hypothetical protein